VDTPKAARDAIASKTFAELGTERLLALCEATGAGREIGGLLRVFRQLMLPWGQQRIGALPRYRSGIADDEAPFEFSLALCDEVPEVQAYVEVQGEPPSLRSNMLAGRAVLESVASELGAPLDRLRRIEQLFFPDHPSPPFALWIGVSCRSGRPVRLKVYLNPQVRGAELALGLVAEAMERLGFTRSWARLREVLSCRDGRDEAAIVCLDLWNGDQSRVKVYLRHHRATVSEIDAIACIAEDYQPGDVGRFYGALAQHEGPFLRKPALTEFAFVDPRADRPASITLEFPIGSYVSNDLVALERVERCMTAFGVRCDAYDRAIHAFATRPLAERAGIHAHVTLRRVATRPRIAVYLASEAYLAAAAES
jgi:DMATS type aromatic prenyltransferase